MHFISFASLLVAFTALCLGVHALPSPSDPSCSSVTTVFETYSPTVTFTAYATEGAQSKRFPVAAVGKRATTTSTSTVTITVPAYTFVTSTSTRTMTVPTVLMTTSTTTRTVVVPTVTYTTTTLTRTVTSTTTTTTS